MRREDREEGNEDYEDESETDPERIRQKYERLRFGEEYLAMDPEEKVELVREHSDYWAEKFSEQLQQVREQKQKDREERERAQGDPKSEEMQEHKDAAEHATKTSTDDRYRELNTKLDMAMEGVMPDDLSNIQREYDGLRTEGGEFVEAQDRLKDEIENGGLSMDEAFALLERQRERGEISEDGYSYLHWFIRDHFEP